MLAFGAVVIGIVDASMPHCVASATSERIHLVEPHAEAASPRFFGRFRHDAVDLGDERTVFGMMGGQQGLQMLQLQNSELNVSFAVQPPVSASLGSFPPGQSSVRRQSHDE